VEANNAQVVLDAGKAIQSLQDSHLPSSITGSAPFLIVPGGGVKSLERLLPTPLRARALVTARTVAGFTDYLARHVRETTAVFAWAGDKSFVGVVDYHGPADPQWCSHRVTLALIKTPEWQVWEGKDGEKMGQEDFASFLEDNLPDIASPAGADLLEVANELWATKSVNFVSSVRLDNGQHQLRYEESITGSARKGTLDISPTFTLGIAPFEGTCRFEVTARFRYRIDTTGKLLLWYDLLQPERVLDTAYNLERQRIADLLKVSAPTAMIFDAQFKDVAPGE
jgi:uncharacterized protein YfdQ (DUF2303 family)